MTAAREFWCRLLGESGEKVTWVVPAFTYRWARTNNRFEVSRTRSEIGWFSESFRIFPEVQRSAQPSHSVAALGPLSHSLLSGHEDEGTPFSRKGVWGKLYDADAVILLLGVDPMTISFFHAVEDWSGDPWRHTRHRKRFRLILADGSEIQRSFHLHAPHPGRRNVIPWLQEVGVIKNWKISGVNIYALSSRKLVDTLLPLVKRNPGWFHAPWRDSWKGMVGGLGAVLGKPLPLSISQDSADPVVAQPVEPDPKEIIRLMSLSKKIAFGPSANRLFCRMTGDWNFIHHRIPKKWQAPFPSPVMLILGSKKRNPTYEGS